MKWLRLSLACLTLTSFLAPPLVSYAQTTPSVTLDEGFDPNYILDDDDIFNVNGMTRADIQLFLKARGTLGDRKELDIDGVTKPIADIIWRVATSYKLNPKYLMALIQKEQSLVEDPSPTQRAFDWAAGYAVCDSCSKDDPAIQAFKGFANQLEYAAKQHRERYLLQLLGKGATLTGYAPGKKVTIGGIAVVPVNNATAMLYTYTPHIHGNENLWRIWQRWFSVAFTDGSVIKAKTSGKTYLIHNGKKRLITSKAVLASLVDPNKVIQAEDSQLSTYLDTNPISFPNYSIVQTPDNKIYLINGDTKRHIVSTKVFYKLGFNDDDIIDASVDDVAGYSDGKDITTSTTNPTGVLAKDPKNNIWFIEDGIRHFVPDKVFIKLYFNDRRAKTYTQKQIDANTIGDPLRLHDGELVKSNAKNDTSVYVIENGLKRPIPSAQVFEGLGWQWKNIVTLPSNLLKGYETGDTIDLYRRPNVTPEDNQDEDTNPIQLSNTSSTPLALK